MNTPNKDRTTIPPNGNAKTVILPLIEDTEVAGIEGAHGIFSDKTTTPTVDQVSRMLDEEKAQIEREHSIFQEQPISPIYRKIDQSGNECTTVVLCRTEISSLIMDDEGRVSWGTKTNDHSYDSFRVNRISEEQKGIVLRALEAKDEFIVFKINEH